MCCDANIMFQANIPKKVIQQTSGHQSLKALRSYERISERQHTAVSNLLVAGKSPDLVTNSTSQAIYHLVVPLKHFSHPVIH